MVKKKTKKTSNRKKNDKQILQKDFYAFQEKVNRLEEFKHELNSLESRDLTKGFEKEIGIIKSRLKDTSALPELEGRMKQLRLEIRKKREVKRKSPIKVISKKVDNIDDSIEKSNIKISHKVDNIDSHIEEKNLELKKEIKDLKSKIDEDLSDKRKVDSKVGFVVDENFNNFIHGLKLELSDRVKNREKELNNQLRNDLELRRRALEAHYIDMEKKLSKDYEFKKTKLASDYELKTESDKKKIQELNKEYSLKKSQLQELYEVRVANDLKKEIQRRFSEELKKKFDVERTKIDYYYITKMKEKYQEEFEKQKDALESKFKIRLVQEMNNQKKIGEKEVKSKLEGLEQAYRSKQDGLEIRKKQLEKTLREKISHVGFDKSKEHKLLKNKLKELEKTKKIHQSEFSSKLALLKKQIDENNRDVNKIKLSLKTQLSKEAHDEIVKKVRDYRKKINEEIKKNFVNKMETFTTQQRKLMEQEIDERTKQLEEELAKQRKINSTLNQNISEMKYQLAEKKGKVLQLLHEQRNYNKKLINERMRIKEEERLKHEDQKHQLIEIHKKEVQRVTDNLNRDFQNHFDSEVKKRIEQDKRKLNEEYNLKKDKLKSLSFRERRKAKSRLIEEYNNNLQKAKINLTKELQAKLHDEFDKKIKAQVSLEKKKFENNLKALQNKYENRERVLQLHEKSLLEKEKENALNLASEKKKLMDKFNFMAGQENSKFKNERIRIQKEAVAKAHQQMVDELKTREERLKSNLEREFKVKLKEHDEQQKANLDKRKAELIEELKKKASALLS